jgi:hypothetical protein
MLITMCGIKAIFNNIIRRLRPMIIASSIAELHLPYRQSGIE